MLLGLNLDGLVMPAEQLSRIYRKGLIMKRLLAIMIVAFYVVSSLGCASLPKDYTFNGIPLDKLYVDSGQVKTDATPAKKESWWDRNKGWIIALIVVDIVVGAVLLADAVDSVDDVR